MPKPEIHVLAQDGGSLLLEGPEQTALIFIRISDGDIETNYWLPPGPKTVDEGEEWLGGDGGREPDGSEGGVWWGRTQKSLNQISKEISNEIGRPIKLVIPKGNRVDLDAELNAAFNGKHDDDPERAAEIEAARREEEGR